MNKKNRFFKIIFEEKKGKIESKIERNGFMLFEIVGLLECIKTHFVLESKEGNKNKDE